jgi:hypothetical protein
MQGQWLGRYSGTNMGEAIVELDDVGDHYEGKAYVIDDQPQMPSTLAYIALPKLFGVERTRLLVHDVLGEVEHVLRQPHVLDVFEIFRFAAPPAGSGQRADQA